jgi:hypothetical protein
VEVQGELFTVKVCADSEVHRERHRACSVQGKTPSERFRSRFFFLLKVVVIVASRREREVGVPYRSSAVPSRQTHLLLSCQSYSMPRLPLNRFPVPAGLSGSMSTAMGFRVPFRLGATACRPARCYASAATVQHSNLPNAMKDAINVRALIMQACLFLTRFTERK